MEAGTSRQGSRTSNATQSKTKTRVSPVYDDEGYDTETPIDDPPAPKGSRKKKSVSTPKQKSTPVSSISDFAFNNGAAAQSKTKKRVSPEDDDEAYDTEVPVVDPEVLKGQSKRKKKSISTPKQKVKPTPVTPQYSISGFTFTNESGNMSNMNIGNIYNSNISDAFNDNSENWNWRRKPA